MPRPLHPRIVIMRRNIGVLVAGLLATLTAACDPKIRIVTVSPSSSIASAQIVRMQPNAKEGNLYIAWRQTAPRLPSQVLFRKVHVTTSPMGPLLALGTSESALSELDMAVSGNHTYVVFEDRPPDVIAPDVMIAASRDDAVTFEPARNVSATTGRSSLNPRVAASGASVFVAWIEQTTVSNRYEVHASVSTDGGTTFSSPQVLASGAPLLTPQIGIAGQEVFVAYCELPGTSYVRRRALSGGTWGAPERITSDGGTAACGHEALASFGTTMFAVGMEFLGGYPQVVARRSTNGGPLAPAGSQGLRVPETLRASAMRHRVYVAVRHDDSENYAPDISVLRSDTDTSLSRPVSTRGFTNLTPLSLSMSAWGDYARVAWHGTPYSDNVLAVSSSHHVYGTRASYRLLDADSNQVYGINPDIQSREDDYYIVWRRNDAPGSSRIMLFSHRAWRLFD